MLEESYINPAHRHAYKNAWAKREAMERGEKVKLTNREKRQIAKLKMHEQKTNHGILRPRAKNIDGYVNIDNLIHPLREPINGAFSTAYFDQNLGHLVLTHRGTDDLEDLEDWFNNYTTFDLLRVLNPKPFGSVPSLLRPVCESTFFTSPKLCKSFLISAAVSASIVVFAINTPPNAEVGSQAKALK
jgi:hypothetical protein